MSIEKEMRSEVYERLRELCKKNNLTPTSLCIDITGSQGNLATWKKGNIRSDYLLQIADRFGVSVDYLLGRNNSLYVKKSMSQDNIDIGNLSESQRAMLKYRIHQLMVNKYRKEDFFADLDKDLGTDNSFKWFRCLNDFSLDEKIPQMLVGTNVDVSSIFDTMSIAIKSKSTAQALSMEYAKDAAFPIIVSGNKFFSALSTLSLASLSILENDLPSQISIKQINSADSETELTTSYRTNSNREIAAFGGKATKGTLPKRKPEIT